MILNKGKDFWSVFKKVKGLKSCRVNTIDNVTGNENIANHFSEHYKKLYNCVSFDNLQMNRMLKDIDNLVDSKCRCDRCYRNHYFSLSNVIYAIKQLKQNKSDGSKLWSNKSYLCMSQILCSFKPPF